MVPFSTVNYLYTVTDGTLCISCLFILQQLDFNPFNLGYWAFSRCCEVDINIRELLAHNDSLFTVFPVVVIAPPQGYFQLGLQ